MNPRHHAGLGLAKRMKGLGFPQDRAYACHLSCNGRFFCVERFDYPLTEAGRRLAVAAFSVAEMICQPR